MPDAPEVAIEAALLAQAEAFALAQSLTISIPTKVFTPPESKPASMWLRATVLPADTETLGVRSTDTNKLYGYLQLDVFFGQPTASAPARLLTALRIAAAAITYFARGTSVTRDGFKIEIIKQPYRTAQVKSDPWIMIPTRIPYCCFANPA